jgi:hypothetical protein
VIKLLIRTIDGQCLPIIYAHSFEALSNLTLGVSIKTYDETGNITNFIGDAIAYSVSRLDTTKTEKSS